MPDTLQESAQKAYDIPLDEIMADEEFNCRGRIAPIDVVDLARSIQSYADQHGDSGLQQPIVVQPFTYPDKPNVKYRIVAGHRRYTAFKVLERKTIPAFIKEGLNEFQARAFNLTENLKREALNPLQEAKAIAPFKNAGWTQEDIADYINASRGWVQVRCMILDLPPEIQKEVAAGFLNQEQIRQINTMPKAEQFAAVRMIKERREKGEKGRISAKPRKVHPMAKKEREQAEIFALQETIQELFGNSLTTRVMGWCAGVVSDWDIHRDIRDLAQEKGKTYKIPDDIIQNL